MADEVKTNIKISQTRGLFIFTFIFVFISDDTLLFQMSKDEIFTTIKYFAIIFATIMLLLKLTQKGTISISKQNLSFFLILSLCIFITMMVNLDFRRGYLYKIILLVYAFSFVILYDLETFARCFIAIIRFLAICSLVGFFIVAVNPKALAFAPIFQSTNGLKYYNLFIFTSPVSFYSGFVRNQGIFREPGVYQMYLMLALIMDNFLLKNKSVKRIILFSATIVSTMSTTGYIALAFFLLVLILKADGITKHQKEILIFLAVVAFILMASFTTIFSLDLSNQYNSVFAKILNPKRSSTVARFASITENLLLAFEKPLAGVGITKLDELFPVYSLKHYGFQTTHNTNTLMIQFASHGFLYGIVWVVGMYRLSKRIDKKNSSLLFLIFFILFAGENLTYSCYSNLLLAYGLNNKKETIFL